MKVFTLFSAIIFIFLANAQADIFEQTFGEEPLQQGEVVVERPIDLIASYKQRRTKHGGILSVNYENFYPLDYTSMFANSGYIENIVGAEPLKLVSIEAGYKRNIPLGSIAILAGYARGGSAASGDPSNSRSIEVNRTTVSANFAFDNYTEEPWVVPYLQGGIYNMAVTENFGDTVNNDNSGYGFSYRAGVLFQLNWIENAIDPSTQTEGLRSSGLENTFLDVYFNSQMASSGASAPDEANNEAQPNMSTGFDMGIGLKLEF